MMLRVLEAVHGHLGFLAMVALLHPAILLRGGRPLGRGARWSVALTTVATVVTFGLGIAMYPAYREGPKVTLLERAPTEAMLFEVKEHVAFVVVALAIAAALAALLATPPQREVRRAAGTFYAAAAAACAVVATLGVWVAATETFP